MKRAFKAIAILSTAALCLSGCGGRAEKLQSSRVTKGEWEIAFSYLTSDGAEFTVTETSSYEMQKGIEGAEEERYLGEVSIGRKFEYVRSGGLERVSGYATLNRSGDVDEVFTSSDPISVDELAEDGREDYESYFDRTAGMLYLSNEYGWSKASGASPLTRLDGDFVLYGSTFESYTYREDENGYCYKPSENNKESGSASEPTQSRYVDKTIVKFDDSARVSAIIVVFEEYQRRDPFVASRTASRVEYLFSYGPTAIKLPVV